MVCSHCSIAETDTKYGTDRDIDKLAQNSMGICVGVFLYSMKTSKSTQPIFIGFGVGQCEQSFNLL